MPEQDRAARDCAVGVLVGELVGLVHEFGDRFLVGQTVEASALKVAHEADELAKHPHDLVEAGDVLVTLISWCRHRDVRFEQLVLAASAKMEVNLARRWEWLADGTLQHVEESA